MTQQVRRSRGYPWDKWFKKKRFKLKKGKDFNCAPHSMSVQVRNAAKKRGKKVSIYIIYPEVYVHPRKDDAVELEVEMK